MSETFFSLVSTYGAYVIFASAFLSCLLVPIPTSLMMLSGGAFVASGDLVLWHVLVAAFAGACLGDQCGYAIGRFGGAKVLKFLARGQARKAALARAEALVDRRGGLGVFLSTWLIAPLGPWVNFIAGGTGLDWRRYSLADVTGEAIWVAVYIGLGFAFSSQIETVAEIAGNIVGLIAALAVAFAMALWIRSVLRHGKQAR